MGVTFSYSHLFSLDHPQTFHDPYNSFLLLNNISLYEYTTFCLSSSLDGHLGCFHFELLFLLLWAFKYKFLFEHSWVLGYSSTSIELGVELLGHVILCFNPRRNCQTVSQSDWIILHFHLQCTRLLIIPHPCKHLLSFLLYPSTWVLNGISGWVFFFFLQLKILYIYYLIDL